MRILLLFFSLVASGFAQRDQVSWSLSTESLAVPPGSRILMKMQASIRPGWHLYSMTTDAAIPTRIELLSHPAVESYRVFQPAPKRAYDPNFQLETETYDNEAVFLIEAQFRADASPGSAKLTASARYQVCDDKSCIPPVTRTAATTVTIDSAAPVATIVIPVGYAEGKPGVAQGLAPVQPAEQRFSVFLLIAFGFGLAAVFTPCVFPMIPITMSYFLNRQSASRRDSITQALVFCLGIIFLFTALGLAATAILGPFGIVQIGSNPWVNGFIALVFLVFGLSMLGAFEITIPSSVLTKLDSASQRGGFAGTMLMGLTFSLTSFACVGPFVGTLLAASIQGGSTRPLLGMAAFASGLALPFFLLALFPSYLKKLPKSGGWLARVKVVMGFIILAAALKYVSSIDQVMQWNFLTRERFLAAWVVLFALAGLYLLGFLRLEGVRPEDRIGVGRLLTGAAFLIFAISLIPGMFGGRLGELDAYVPLAREGSGLGLSGQGELTWMKNELEPALQRARQENRLVFVNFTGYACTNCHWMKANMFSRPEIQAALGRYILVELYTDGADPESEANQRFQEATFKTIAIPYYAILDQDGNVVASFPGLTRRSQEFLSFLDKGSQGMQVAQTQPASGQPAGTAEITTGNSGLRSLSATRLDGSVLDPGALQGKVAVVNFWATWCVPCIQEIPSFNQLHEELGAKGVAVLGVSLDEEGAPLVRKFIKDHPMKYDVAIGSEGLDAAFQVEQLPTTVIFDRAGREVKRFEGYTEHRILEEAVRSAL